MIQLLGFWNRGATFPESRCQLSGAFGAEWRGEGGCREALTSSGCGGGCTERRCFCTEGAAAMLTLESHLELLPSAPLSHKSGCNLRKLCPRPAIWLEWAVWHFPVMFHLEWRLLFVKKGLLLTCLRRDAFLPPTLPLISAQRASICASSHVASEHAFCVNWAPCPGPLASCSRHM